MQDLPENQEANEAHGLESKEEKETNNEQTDSGNLG